MLEKVRHHILSSVSLFTNKFLISLSLSLSLIETVPFSNPIANLRPSLVHAVCTAAELKGNLFIPFWLLPSRKKASCVLLNAISCYLRK